MRLGTRGYIGIVCLASAVILLSPWSDSSSQGLHRFLLFLSIAAFSSGLNIALPGVRGTMPASFVFVLVGIARLSMAETITVGLAGTLVQYLWKSNNGITPMHWLFTAANTTIVTSLCYSLYHWTQIQTWDAQTP